MNKQEETIDEILCDLSFLQHELGTKGLIPLSKHEHKAKARINRLIVEATQKEFQDMVNAGEDFRKIKLDGVEHGKHLGDVIPYDLYIMAEDIDRYMKNRMKELSNQIKEQE